MLSAGASRILGGVGVRPACLRDNPVLGASGHRCVYGTKAPSTHLTLTTGTGDVSVDSYDATPRLQSQTGNASLKNVQGQVNVDIGTGSISIRLAGSGWA